MAGMSGRVAATAILVAGIAACGTDESATDDTADGGTVTIAATTPVIADLVDLAVDELDGAAVSSVMPIGADPHEFEPSARQAELLAEADLLVTVGVGLEAGLDDAIDAARDSGAMVVELSSGIDLLPGDRAHDEGGDHDDESETADPHIWMDPIRMATALSGLREPLLELGFDGSEVDTALERANDELRALDRTVAETVAPIPAERRVLVTNHDSLSYFADRYGFEIVGTVIPSLTTLAEPSAAELERLADEIVARSVPALFAETTDSDRLARALADEIGDDVQIVELYTGSLGEPGSGAETYRGLMLTDAERIATALS